MNDKHKPEFEKLAFEIKRIIGSRKTYFMLNEGNWGDSLIREGTEKFFKDNLICYEKIENISQISFDFLHRWENIFNIIKIYKRSVLIFSGSGAFCKHYDRCDLIKKLACKFNKVIILPSTFEFPVDFPKNVTVYVRDKYQSHENIPNANFCHDMAFYLDLKSDNAIEKSVHILRQDVESSNKKTNQTTIDLSSMGNHTTPIDGFVREIGSYENIHTDRLHVAIAATLLGRNVSIYANNYFKIKAIFYSSIKDYYPNAKFFN